MKGRARSGDSPWSQPGFAPFWTAFTVSSFGNCITTLAIQVLVVLTLHEGAGGVGLLQAALWLPYLLFGVVAGVLVDRAQRRPLLIATDLARGVLLVAVPVLATTHDLTLTTLLIFMAIFGLLSLVNDAAAQSFLPRLVPPHLLIAANARLDQSDAVAQTSGPAVAGALVWLLSAPWAVLVDAASYLASGVLLLRVPVVEPARRRAPLRTVRHEAVEGLRWVYTHTMLRPLALSTHSWFFFLALAGAVETPFALRILGLNALGLGLVLAVGGIGGLAGSLAATRLGARFGTGRVVVACSALTGLAWGVIALSPPGPAGWFLFAAGQWLFGLSIGAQNANSLGYRQLVTADRLQGRTNATIRSINRAMIVIGAPVGGMLGDAIGFRPILWTSAVGFLAGAAALGLSNFRHVRIEGGAVAQHPLPAGHRREAVLAPPGHQHVPQSLPAPPPIRRRG